MVKITNTSGDVKVGKQGEAVYQRRYGEQIRRTVSPKRAIASEAQIAHRQLYKDALAWRSQLSLPNRRYLDGYCIANGIVDDYHIPLPWSRFALKLYLAKVKFVTITKPSYEYSEEQKMFEKYDASHSTDSKIYAQYWKTQTFTPQETHFINKIELLLRRKSFPYTTATFSIKEVGEDEKPFGPDLTYVEYSLPGTLPDTNTWIELELPEYELLEGKLYAIVVRLAEGNSNNCLIWRCEIWGEPYEEGKYGESNDYGVTWSMSVAYEANFREYGKKVTESGTEGLIHVRHPALSTVIQKRGELTVRGYENLSSLDEEYLTGQVGLDVMSGDLIEVTTLPGIDYNYLVK